MSNIALLAAGAAAGALSTGALQVFMAWQARRLKRRVAARLMLGELYVAQHDLECIRLAEEWPERHPPDFAALTTTWTDHREALAASVDAVEWNDIADVCRRLVALPGTFDPAEQVNAENLAAMGGLIDRINYATTALLAHSATERERKALIATHAERRALAARLESGADNPSLPHD